MMSSNIVKRNVVLLPNYFKWVGLAVIVIAVIIFWLSMKITIQ